MSSPWEREYKKEITNYQSSFSINFQIEYIFCYHIIIKASTDFPLHSPNLDKTIMKILKRKNNTIR